MPKYYCDYCRSYLTHDAKSVRKSHLLGKNHIKYYCDYYEEQAKKLDKWEDSELPYEITADELYRGIPQSQNIKDLNDEDGKSAENLIEKHGFVPPPPTLASLPNPPPSVYHYDMRLQKQKIADLVRDLADEHSL